MRFLISHPFFSRLIGVSVALVMVPALASCNTPVEEAEVVDPAAEEDVAIDSEADPEAMPEEAPEAAGDTIVDVAAADGSFETLLAAAEAAGLAETLSSEGPFTVFAPTDEAFAALPEGTVDALLLPENQEVLAEVLAYHVLPVAVPSEEAATGAVQTVSGEDLELVVDETGVTVGGATVVQPDVEASNGVIHAIDTVLLPPSLDASAL